MTYFLLTLLMFVGLFLMAVILLQRGRGGGLAGAFGGLGGQSAFGTRAGDTFTWITVVAVILWVILAALTGRSMRADQPGQGLTGSDDVEVSEDSSADEKGGKKKSDDLGLPGDFEDFPVGPGKGKSGGAPEGAGTQAPETKPAATEGDASTPAATDEAEKEPAGESDGDSAEAQ